MALNDAIMIAALAPLIGLSLIAVLWNTLILSVMFCAGLARALLARAHGDLTRGCEPSRNYPLAAFLFTLLLLSGLQGEPQILLDVPTPRHPIDRDAGGD